MKLAGTRGYIGQVGKLVELPVVSTLSSSEERKASDVTTLAGRRVVFAGAQSRRSWKVQVQGALPHEIGALGELLRDSAGPHVWVDPYAQVTNTLTPDQASFKVAPQGGAARGGVAVDGVVSSSAAAPAVAGGVLTVGPTPVVAGYTVTVSSYAYALKGSVSAVLQWHNWAGSLISSVYGTDVVSNGVMVRPYVTSVAPADAALVSVGVRGADVITRPAISWTAEPVPWGSGNGCSQAAVFSWDADVRATFAQVNAPRTKVIGFDVMEVG